jgi:hypothetical protein
MSTSWLLLQVLDDGGHRLLFPLGEVQGFVNGVREIRILLDFLGQGGIPQKIGVHHNDPAHLTTVVIGVKRQGNYLVRRHERHQAFVKVIRLLAILHLAPEVLLEGNKVKISDEADGLAQGQRGNSGQVDNAEQRMRGLGQVGLPAILGDGVETIRRGGGHNTTA